MAGMIQSFGCVCQALSLTQRVARAATILLLLVSLASLVQAQVTTPHSDSFSSGQSIQGTILSPGDVGVRRFGKITPYLGDGDIYGLPLYMAKMTAPETALHNVVYMGTGHDSVDPSEANTEAGPRPSGHKNFIHPAAETTIVSTQTVSTQDANSHDAVLPLEGSINYGSGFTSKGLVLNLNAVLNGARLRLTDGGIGEIASAWYTNKVNIQSFAQQFSFQITNPSADGMTFAIQNVETTAFGPGGGGLGYGAGTPGGNGGIPTSVAVKFDLYNNDGEGIDSTGLYVNGASPTIPAIDMTSSGVNLHSGDVFDVWMTYDGTALAMQITDTTTQATFTTSWTIDIPATVGGDTAYVGFTGATGGASSTQEVLNWMFTSQGAVEYGSGFTSNNLDLNYSATLNGTRLELTDGQIGEIASAWYATPVDVLAFTQEFSFQLTNPRADGMTFTIQNVSTSATGPGGAGLGYGASSPGGNGGISNSVAVKFDLYNNFGEGIDSTGLYTEGASPTVPAIDMSSSGVNLHSGDVFNVRMTYDGTTLSMRITDATTQATFQTSWTINIPLTVGAGTAYVGFTGATGGDSATQEILSWIYIP